ncbi:MAG TPA: hypothetical protein VF809_01265 [Candidatus Saccharimonadales bacterium]
MSETLHLGLLELPSYEVVNSCAERSVHNSPDLKTTVITDPDDSRLAAVADLESRTFGPKNAFGVREYQKLLGGLAAVFCIEPRNNGTNSFEPIAAGSISFGRDTTTTPRLHDRLYDNALLFTSAVCDKHLASMAMGACVAPEHRRKGLHGRLLGMRELCADNVAEAYGLHGLLMMPVSPFNVGSLASSLSHNFIGVQMLDKYYWHTGEDYSNYRVILLKDLALGYLHYRREDTAPVTITHDYVTTGEYDTLSENLELAIPPADTSRNKKIDYIHAFRRLFTLGYYCHRVSTANGVNSMHFTKRHKKDIDWREVINSSVSLAAPLRSYD